MQILEGEKVKEMKKNSIKHVPKRNKPQRRIEERGKGRANKGREGRAMASP